MALGKTWGSPGGLEELCVLAGFKLLYDGAGYHPCDSLLTHTQATHYYCEIQPPSKKSPDLLVVAFDDADGFADKNRNLKIYEILAEDLQIARERKMIIDLDARKPEPRGGPAVQYLKRMAKLNDSAKYTQAVKQRLALKR